MLLHRRKRKLKPQMYKGLSTEFLLQLFFVFEGFTFWKVIELPAKTGVVASDYEDACQQILSQNGKAADKIEEGNKFKKSRDNYLFWAKIVNLSEKGYISCSLIAVFLVVSSWIDTTDETFRLFLALFITVYEVIKFIGYQYARNAYIDYKKRLDGFSKINHVQYEINSKDFSPVPKEHLKKSKKC